MLRRHTRRSRADGLPGEAETSYQLSFVPPAEPSVGYAPRVTSIRLGGLVADIARPPVPGVWLLETTLYDEAGRQYLFETRVVVEPLA